VAVAAIACGLGTYAGARLIVGKGAVF